MKIPIRLLLCEIAMYWDAKLVKPLPDYRIYVELKNISYFNQVDIFFGAVTWPNEQDIAPETLVDEMVWCRPE